jgi:hypothetical protein
VIPAVTIWKFTCQPAGSWLLVSCARHRVVLCCAVVGKAAHAQHKALALGLGLLHIMWPVVRIAAVAGRVAL